MKINLDHGFIYLTSCFCLGFFCLFYLEHSQQQQCFWRMSMWTVLWRWRRRQTGMWVWSLKLKGWWWMLSVSLSHRLLSVRRERFGWSGKKIPERGERGDWSRLQWTVGEGKGDEVVRYGLKERIRYMFVDLRKKYMEINIWKCLWLTPT